jgi:hypothetical protein
LSMPNMLGAWLGYATSLNRRFGRLDDLADGGSARGGAA